MSSTLEHGTQGVRYGTWQVRRGDLLLNDARHGEPDAPVAVVTGAGHGSS